ncbi:capsular biosynthesis protein [Microbulbifer sp. OS29]|uniref:Capsular biosynthesis protein n=1 Tax=Microbulbifer okhotskensis TaxID=2926617 RepID=A0A9X2J5J9_9GAMM|nr:capsular biosynthesis protein [Microbulbifer okhotskensis]MCO1334484.1 capsular biosynthesis protein [Microbulbifer okhotskensis]
MSVAVFLQGPHGPFFAKLAKRLSQRGVITHKINLNGGDRYFGWADFQSDFGGCEGDWSSFFRAYLLEHSVEAVFVYGDCRSYHSKARAVCESLNIAFAVFEEGYLRPDFVTLEWGGVNAFSEVNWSREAIERYEPSGRQPGLPVGQTFWHRACFAIGYYAAMRLANSRFPQYHHHRNRDWKAEAICWLRSFARKALYKATERSLTPRLVGEFSRRFFLFPLQTRDDFQLREHSDLLSIENAIDGVLKSFAENAPNDAVIVIKHHPMDRGFCHYQKLIDILEVRYSIQGRVIYCHDLHLPTLLDHTLGVVTINSTVGISALLHKVPTKVLGRALYDMPGLTHQGVLSSFWSEPAAVDFTLFQRFHTYLYEQTQVDGSFSRAARLTIDGVAKRLQGVAVGGSLFGLSGASSKDAS